jgi:DNA-binding GntR family transcriptional regulator
MDKRNAIVVSQDALSEALRVSRMTIHRAVTILKEKKILAVIKSGGSNIYAINSEIAWKNDAEGKRYAYFTAKVYVVESEQEIPFKTDLIGHAIKKKKRVSS